MENVAKFVHRIVQKFVKKKNRRRSIEPKWDHGAFRREDQVLTMEKEIEEEEVDEVTPLVSPSRARSIAFLRASTPVKTNGIFVHEGSNSESVEEEEKDEDGVSQAEEAEDWEKSIQSIGVDSPSEFHVIGGEASDSSLSMDEIEDTTKEGDEEKEKGKVTHTVSPQSEFIFTEEWEEDELEDLNEMQSAFPVKKEEEYTIHPTVLKEDQEGYFWDEPEGFSDPTLAPAIPSPLAVPSLCRYSEKDLRNVARSLMEEDGKKTRKQWERTNNKCVIDSSPSISSPRPDTPTTNGDISPARANLSDGSVESADTSATVVSPDASLELVRPECANDEDNAWLRNVFEKAGLAHEIPQWMRVDPPEKMRVEDEWRVERRVGFATSTPEIAFASPAFSSISAIGRNLSLNDSNATYSSPLLNGSFCVGDKTISLDVSVKARAALAKPQTDFYTFTHGIEEEEE